MNFHLMLSSLTTGKVQVRLVAIAVMYSGQVCIKNTSDKYLGYIVNKDGDRKEICLILDGGHSPNKEAW